MYKYMYGDSQRIEKEKSQYQDTIFSEAEQGHDWEVLYDIDVVDPAASQPSKETSRAFLLEEKGSLPLFWSWWLLGSTSFRTYGH